jgi:hypothetical protein
MLAYAKRLIALRGKCAALRRGDMVSLHAQSGTCAFARTHASQTAITVLNAADDEITLDLRVDNLLSDGTRLVREWPREEVVVQGGYAHDIRLGAREGAVWLTAGT